MRTRRLNKHTLTMWAVLFVIELTTSPVGSCVVWLWVGAMMVRTGGEDRAECGGCCLDATIVRLIYPSKSNPIDNCWDIRSPISVRPGLQSVSQAVSLHATNALRVLFPQHTDGVPRDLSLRLTIDKRGVIAVNSPDRSRARAVWRHSELS